MSKRELEHQRDIIKSFERHQGYGLKMSHRFKAGVLDLLLCLEGYEGFVMELKEVTWPFKSSTKLTLDMTVLQRREGIKMRRGGLPVCWGLISHVRGERSPRLLLGRNLEQETIEQETFKRISCYRFPNKVWPAHVIADWATRETSDYGPTIS